MSFEKAMEFVFRWEGGYVDNTHLGDSGGVSAFGISQRAYPQEPMSEMTVERAAFLYRRDYWDAINGDELASWPSLAISVFDYAVNSGPRRAASTLQRGVKVRVDATIGPQTLAAVAAADMRELVEFVLHERATFLLSLDQRNFERGWIRRVVSLALEAGRMEENYHAE